MKEKPLISAIVSTYNSEEFIRGRIENLLNQTVVDLLEIVIVNSGSQQNEDKIIREYLSHDNIKYINTPHRETIYKAWNRGIKAASGKYITNANTDDRLRNDALEVLSSALEKNGSAAFVYADQLITETPNQSFEKCSIIDKQVWPEFRKEFLFATTIGGPQPMWRASIHTDDNIWFDETLEVAGDYRFVCDISLKHNLIHVPQFLGVYYKSRSKTNKEFQDFGKTFWETYYIRYNYIHNYLDSLSKSDIESFLRHFLRNSELPRTIHSLKKRASDFLRIGTPMFSKEFESWIGAVILKYLGREQDAVFLCEKYLSKKKSQFIETMLCDLKKNKGTGDE